MIQCVRHPAAMRRLLGDQRSVITVGAFDGIHRGHQALLMSVAEHARATDAVPVVMSFEPTPKEYFSQKPPARITNFRERVALFDTHGMAAFFCARFGPQMASIGVTQFIETFLVQALRARHVVVGDDFRFGHQAAGGVADLVAAGKDNDFTVQQFASVQVADVRVSSTEIRDALALGDMSTVQRALGRPYTLSGKVIKGQQLGRTLGYPTANIALHRRVSPVAGIFAVRVSGIDAGHHMGVASIGTRPTVNGEGVLLEVFVFDYSGDLYDKRLRVELVAKIRDEAHFDSLDALTDQMNDDARRAREILGAA